MNKISIITLLALVLLSGFYFFGNGILVGVSEISTSTETPEQPKQTIAEPKKPSPSPIKNKVKTWRSLSLAYSQSNHEIQLIRSEKFVTSTNGRQFPLIVYELPFLPTRLKFGRKPLFYVDTTKTEVYAVTGDGVFFRGSREDLGKDTLKLKTLAHNLRQIITDEDFYRPGWYSIKDLKMYAGKIFISYTKKVGNAYTLSILVADASSEPLHFEDFFTVPYNADIAGSFNAHSSGGRIVAYKDNKLLIGTGDFNKWKTPQDPSILLGKIFSIDIDTKETVVISAGHRNVQGLFYDPENKTIFSTEHGPRGGDEINLNIGNEGSVANFGWPISSYGKHYDGKAYADAPLYKSHAEYGYIEPIKFFTPSVGISEIIKVPTTFGERYSNDYFAASMGMDSNAPIHSLHHFRLDDEYKEVIATNTIHIGDRIRDVHLLNDKEILLALEGDNTPALAIMQAK